MKYRKGKKRYSKKSYGKKQSVKPAKKYYMGGQRF